MPADDVNEQKITTHVCVAEAALQLDALIDRAEAGETIILTLDGKPSVQLVLTSPKH